MKKYLLYALMLSALFISCSKDSEGIEPDSVPPIAEQKKYPILIATPTTRATDAGFEVADQVGLYVVNYSAPTTAGTIAASGNHVDNMRFTYSGSWAPDQQIYWKDTSTKADFYAYYPYTSTIDNIAAVPVSVIANQSIEANYKSSDLLWGKTLGVAPTKDPVNLTVKHLMSNIIVKLVAGNGYKKEDLARATILICGLKTAGTANYATGEITATGSVLEITPRKETGQYRALVIPQSALELDLIKVTIDDNTFMLKQTIDFVSNKQHTCTITIERTSEGINIGIGDWDNDGNDYGGSVG